MATLRHYPVAPWLHPEIRGCPMEEPLKRGESVTLRDVETATLGRILAVTSDGEHVEVEWHVRPGHEHEITTEDVAALRRAHESDFFETA